MAVTLCGECGHPMTDHETSGQVTTCLLVRVNRTNDPDDEDPYTQCPCFIYEPEEEDA